MIELKAELREKTKKSACKEYRRNGKIPAIIYGQGKNTNIILDNHEFGKVYPELTKSTVIGLTLGKKKYEVLIKDYDKDYINETMRHLDFYELKKGKTLHAKLPLHFVGTAKGMRDGGIVEKHISEIEIECLPKNIIPHLEIDISEMGLNESLHVSDIKLDEKKFKIITHLEEVIVKIAGKSETAAEEAEGAEAEETAEVAAAE